MQSQPLHMIPESAPFTSEQRAWLNGFLAGLIARASKVPEQVARPKITVLYGSQTGTAEGLARKAVKLLSARGFAASAADMAATRAEQLADAGALAVIVSTYGEGEPPDSARPLHAALAAEPAPKLGSLCYSVLALGDRNYTHFCKAGVEFDAHLERAGARRILPRIDCDGDPSEAFSRWIEAIARGLGESGATSIDAKEAEEEPVLPGTSRTLPLSARVLEVRRLSGPGSAKEVNHVAFSIAGSGLDYQPGDALGVFPRNCPELVEAVLKVLGSDGEEAVSLPGMDPLSLRLALEERLDLGKAPAELLQALGVDPENRDLHVLDALLIGKPLAGPAAAGLLRPLQARLYSIASSPKAHKEEIHLTVGAVRYEAHGRPRKGACSTFLAERALAAGSARVYLHRNNGFRLPSSGDTPVILIGPGTGIAPFRAFLQERAATGATGGSWLFFGDQRESEDFLYREEILAWRSSGKLDRLDLAWSRDQARKIYVQDRMREQAGELWSWLQRGAHVYVCGDASRMAKDVDNTLLEIASARLGNDRTKATEFLAGLRASRRYQRDVY